MASETVSGAVARVRSLVAQQLGTARATIAPPASPHSTRGLTFARGDQVVHLSSGQSGVILSGKRTADLTAAARPF